MKKERFVDWWKQDKRYMTLLKAVLMAQMCIRDSRTDAICISGDAGAALCTGACHRQEEKWIN